MARTYVIADGWLFYVGPVECQHAEDDGHVIDWEGRGAATDEHGVRLQRDGQDLSKAPILSLGAVPERKAYAPPQVVQITPQVDVFADLERGRLVDDELAARVRAMFQEHLGPRSVAGELVEPPPASKSLELLGLELRHRKLQLEQVRTERDTALQARALAETAAEQAIWQRDRALQDLDAARPKLPDAPDVSATEPAPAESSS